MENFIVTGFSKDGVWIQKSIETIAECAEQRAKENGFAEITAIVSESQQQ